MAPPHRIHARTAAADVRRRVVVALVVLLGATTAALWSAGAVSAHAELLGVTPADGEVVQDTPAQVVLRFSEPVSLTGGSARVLDQDATVVSGGPSVEGDDVVIPLGGELPDGTYTVTWVAISEDSHPVSGATVFSIGAPSAGGAAAAAPSAPGAGWGVRAAAATLVAVAYAGALIAVGAWWFLVAVAGPPGADEEGDDGPWRERVRALAGRAAVLGAVAAVASIPLRIARVGGGLGALRENDLLGEALRGPIGISTAITAAALLVFAGLIEPPATRRVRAIPALGVGVIALAGFAYEGHTRTQHPVGLMAAFDVVHLAAGAVWLGGIAALVIAFRGDPPPGVLGRIVRRFSAMAVFAVLTVVAAGTGMAIIVLPSVGDLFTTGYGLTLLVKVAIVAVVIVLGAYNNRRLVPAMSGSAAVLPVTRRRLGTIVVVELVGLLAVVGVTSVLVNRSPVPASAAAPTAPVTTVAPQSVEVPLSSGAGTATYTFVPARAGQNEMVLTLRDPSGQPLVPIEVPTVELTEPTLGVGPLRPLVHPLDDGEFHVIADVDVAGTYDLVIRVRVSDFVAVSARSQVTIAE
jgi:copper transport protein